MPEPPVGLSLVAFKFSSRWAKDVGSFLSSLAGSRDNDEPLELFSHTRYTMLPDLRAVLSAHGPQLRSLVVARSIKDVSVLGLCARLERFECQCLPPDALVAAIPRTIRRLAVTNPPTRQSNITSLAYLTQQLDTFTALRVFTWVGSTAHSGFAALRDRCTQLGRELRTREIDSLAATVWFRLTFHSKRSPFGLVFRLWLQRGVNWAGCTNAVVVGAKEHNGTFA
ncbi:hypothetical protein C8R45DRAFT_1137230 [Mycena sanguinolenta]|nr:hypothetical protein C8R45DRAFT_1137230 [Mycena sanguinolenta]